MLIRVALSVLAGMAALTYGAWRTYTAALDRVLVQGRWRSPWFR